MPKFGDIGTETADSGERKVMWVSKEEVVILSTSVPEDIGDPFPISPGLVTYQIAETKWPEIPENE